MQWESVGPGGGGWLPTMTISADSTLWVGCDVGGVYLSGNLGEAYHQTSRTLRDYSVDMVCCDPGEPSVVYSATSGGVYKSTDRGQTWGLKRNGFPETAKYSYSMPVACIEVDPSDTETVYAGTGRARYNNTGKGKIYKSVNGGNLWSEINKNDGNIPEDAIIYDIDVCDSISRIVYATSDRGVFRSADGGVSWQDITSDLPTANTRYLAVHPADSNTVYITTISEKGQSPWVGGVWKTTDGGQSWMPKSEGLLKHIGSSSESFHMTSNYRILVMDKYNPGVLYTGNTSWVNPQIYRTGNGGETWESLLNDQTIDRGWLTYWGMSVQSIAIHPENSDIVFFGTPGYIQRSLDAGKTWEQVYTRKMEDGTWVGRGLETGVGRRIVFDPADSMSFYSCSMDFGMMKTTNMGESFRLYPDADGGYNTVEDLAVDPSNPGLIFVAARKNGNNSTEGVLTCSTDGGQHWEILSGNRPGLPLNKIGCVAIDPDSTDNERVIYAGLEKNGIYSSNDGGESWIKVFEGDGYTYNSMLFSPYNGGRIYVAADSPDGETNYSGVLWSDDGTNWNAAAMHRVEDIDVDQTNGHVYIACRETWDASSSHLQAGGVYKSTDGGLTWGNPVFENYFVSGVAVAPGGGRIYASTHDHPFHDQAAADGVWMSDDNGQNWRDISGALPLKSVSAISAHPLNRDQVVIGTGGGGTYIGWFEPEVPDGVETDLPAESMLLKNYPNPLSNETTIQFEIQVPGMAALEIFGISGNRIKTLERGFYDPGMHQVRWKGDDAGGNPVPSGIYIYQLKAGNDRVMKRMAVVR